MVRTPLGLLARLLPWCPLHRTLMRSLLSACIPTAVMWYCCPTALARIDLTPAHHLAASAKAAPGHDQDTAATVDNIMGGRQQYPDPTVLVPLPAADMEGSL
jgi:hypothetical protein